MANKWERGGNSNASDKWLKPISSDSLSKQGFRRPSLELRYTPNEPTAPNAAPSAEGTVRTRATEAREKAGETKIRISKAYKARADEAATGVAGGQASDIYAKAGDSADAAQINGAGASSAADTAEHIVGRKTRAGGRAARNNGEATPVSDAAHADGAPVHTDDAASPVSGDVKSPGRRRSRLANRSEADAAQASAQPPLWQPAQRTDDIPPLPAQPQQLDIPPRQPQQQLWQPQQQPQKPVGSPLPTQRTIKYPPSYTPHGQPTAPAQPPIAAQSAAAATISQQTAAYQAPDVAAQGKPTEPTPAAPTFDAPSPNASAPDEDANRRTVYATPAASNLPPTATDEDDDERDAVPSSQMAQPAPVPLNVVEPPRRGGRALIAALVTLVILAAAALALWQTGVLPRILGIENPQPLFNLSISDIFTPKGDDISEAPHQKQSHMDSFTADATNATAPVTIIFDAHTDASITDIRLLSEQGLPLYMEDIDNKPDDTGILWELKVRFDSPFDGEVRAYTRDMTGVWDSAGESLHITVK